MNEVARWWVPHYNLVPPHRRLWKLLPIRLLAELRFRFAGWGQGGAKAHVTVGGCVETIPTSSPVMSNAAVLGFELSLDGRERCASFACSGMLFLLLLLCDLF
jgi:hypothetical protein